MAQTIKLKRSAQSGASGIPSTSDLALGEVGINTYHGKMYIKKDDGTANDPSIVEVGGLPLSGGTLTGSLTAPSLAVDNITIDGNDISTTNSNGNLTITPNGAGNVNINSDTVAITAAENESASLVLASDEADDNPDLWRFRNNTDNTLTIGNQISGSSVDHITITPNATVTNSIAAFAGKITAAGSVTANAGVVVDNITIDGNEIDVGSGDLTLDVAGKINLDHGSPEILLKDDGAHYASFISSNTDFVIQSIVSDKDMLFKGQDGSSTITALTLDMSASGRATFNNNVVVTDNNSLIAGSGDDLQIYYNGTNGEIDVSSGNLTLDVAGDINLDADSGSINFKDGGVSFGTLFKSSSNMILYSSISNGDIKFQGVDGGNNITALSLDMSNAGAATFNAGATFSGRTTSANSTVGSGTASTYVDLTVNGASTSNYGPMIELQSAGTAFGKISNVGRIQGGTSTDMFVTTASTNSLVLGTNNTPRVTINSSGNATFSSLVGINKAVNSAVGLSVGSDANTSTSYGLEVCDSSNQTRFLVDGSGSQRFYGSDNSETARFTDGNLLVGGTSLDASGSVGFTSGGRIRQVTASGVANTTLIGAISGVSNGLEITQDASNNQSYIFNVASTPSLKINSNGNVNIFSKLMVGSTTAPDGKLHVDGLTGSVATILEGNGNGDTAPLLFRVKANNNSVSNMGVFGNAGSTSADNTIHIGPSNTSGITVNQSGNATFSGSVSIGTTDSHRKLTVSGQGSSSCDILIHNDTDGDNTFNGLMFKADSQNNNTRIKGAVFFERTGIRGTGILHLCNDGGNDDSNVGLADSKLSINSTGNVNIGSSLMVGSTTAPSSKFVVSDGGNTGFEINPQHNNSRNVVFSYDRAASAYKQIIAFASDYKFNIAGDTKLEINSSGNVQARRARSNTAGEVALSLQPTDSTIHYGFRIDQATNSFNLDRVDSAGQLLRVEASGNATFSGTVNAPTLTGVTTINTASSAGVLEIYGGATNKGGKILLSGGNNTSDGSDIRFHTGSSTANPPERMRIDSSGALILNNSGGDAQMYFGGTSGTSRMYLARSGLDSLLYNVSNGNLRFGTNNTERLRIDSSGRLLVNSSSNTSRGGTNTRALIKLATGESYVDIQASSTSANGGLLFSDGSGGNYGLIDYAHASDAMLFYTAGSAKMTINSSGNVNIPNGKLGIGFTSVPSATLEVKNSAGATFFMDDTNGRHLRFRTANSGSQNSNISSYAGLHLGGSDNASHLLIDGNGNVGIGVSPSANSSYMVALQLGEQANLYAHTDGVGAGSATYLSNNITHNSGFKYINADAGSQYTQASGAHKWSSFASGSAGGAATENTRMTLTSVGDLLVGKTSSAFGTDGIELQATDNVWITKTGGNPLGLNRKGSDGSIIELYKDTGSLVGSIGVVGGDDLFIAGGATGLRFDSDTAKIYPTNGSGAVSNGALDIGETNFKFRDLYLSGISYVGGLYNSGIYNQQGGDIQFWVPNVGEAVRIQQNTGNLLVGKSSSAFGTTGTELLSDGAVTITRSGSAGGTPFFINRLANSGELIAMYQDTVQKGNISVSSLGMGFGGGTRSSDFFIKTDGTASFASGVNLGVGNGSPLATLTVGSGTGSLNTSAELFVPNNDALMRAIKLGHGASTANITTDDNSKSLTFTTGGSESARITSGNEFLIGCTSAGDAGITLDGSPASNSVPSMELVRDFSGTATMIRFTNISGSPYVGSITSTTSATAYNTSSDERLKDNIKDADDSGSKVDAIQVRQFDWKADGEHQDYGMVAQELLEVAPDAVTQGDTQDDMMGVDYSKLVPMLIKEIQSLRQRVAQLEE